MSALGFAVTAQPIVDDAVVFCDEGGDPLGQLVRGGVGGGVVRRAGSLVATDDVGNVVSYAAANFHWLERMQRGRSYVGDDAEVSHPKHSIIGAGANVRGFVRDSIIWPGTTATGPLDSVIVGPGFRVPIPRRW